MSPKTEKKNDRDQGTKDQGQPDEISLAEIINATGVDGFNGDTMHSIPESFWNAGLSMQKFFFKFSIAPFILHNTVM